MRYLIVALLAVAFIVWRIRRAGSSEKVVGLGKIVSNDPDLGDDPKKAA